MIHRVRGETLVSEPLVVPMRPARSEQASPRIPAARRGRLRAWLMEELAPDRVLRIARRELARFPGDRVVVHVHPTELALLQGATLAAECELAALELREDETLTPGGLRIASPRGEVDATIEQRVERMLMALEGNAP